MPNTAILPFHAAGNRVRAWCVTAHEDVASNSQAVFDLNNYISGYNLRLDVATRSVSGSITWRGMLKFSFVNPLEDNKYRVFTQPIFAYNNSAIGAITPGNFEIAHCINTPQYPKTRDSFWLRVGVTNYTSSGHPSGRATNKMVGVRLWGNVLHKLSVMVI